MHKRPHQPPPSTAEPEPADYGYIRHEALLPQESEVCGPSLEAPPPRPLPEVEPGMLALEELAEDIDIMHDAFVGKYEDPENPFFNL